VILRKQVGFYEANVKEQALRDLTPSILATFPGMSNMFLHCRQVIDSKQQKLRATGGKVVELLWD